MIPCWANKYNGLFANVHYIDMRKCIIFMVPWLVIQLYNVIETLWLGLRRLYDVQGNLDLMFSNLKLGYSYMICINCGNMPFLGGLYLDMFSCAERIKI